MNKFDLNNRTAVITGGAQGFGLDIAKKFLNFGAQVIIWDIDEQQLEIASKEINSSKLSFNRVDVSNFEQINENFSFKSFVYVLSFFSNSLLFFDSKNLTLK